MNSNHEDWTTLLTNPNQINLYYTKAPDLSKVSIHEVSLDRESARLALRFDLSDYPDNPPPKWVLNRFNRVQFTLHLIELYAVKIEGWEHTMEGLLKITKEERGIQLSFANEHHSIIGSGRFLFLAEISGYQARNNA